MLAIPAASSRWFLEKMAWPVATAVLGLASIVLCLVVLARRQPAASSKVVEAPKAVPRTAAITVPPAARAPQPRVSTTATEARAAAPAKRPAGPVLQAPVGPATAAKATATPEFPKFLQPALESPPPTAPEQVSLQEQQEKTKALAIRRHLRSPRKSEILTGSALNEFRSFLCELSDRNPARPDVPLDPALVKKLALTAGHEPEGGGSSPGLLRQVGHIYWPFTLRGATQQRLDDLLQQVAVKAMAGELDAALHADASRTAQKLREELRTKFQQGEIVGAVYLNGKRGLDSLDSALAMLDQADAGRFCSPSYEAKGRTVAELVRQMAAQGVQFAPAPAGAEAAYHALHQAFVTYAATDLP